MILPISYNCNQKCSSLKLLTPKIIITSKILTFNKTLTTKKFKTTQFCKHQTLNPKKIKSLKNIDHQKLWTSKNIDLRKMLTPKIICHPHIFCPPQKMLTQKNFNNLKYLTLSKIRQHQKMLPLKILCRKDFWPHFYFDFPPKHSLLH